ncbi:hypothetical protein GQ55_1G194600 [Panicum hallii var. hallii]|uniref:Uncharacterized protein n=1 Tax=Panicum hallii var. hallii TaxID=1504633 RepID=A0A2T7F698_9POAL|nr:hypothetical protein GQ55_1G194600 [Panicum hallii var. hallii]
MPAPLLQPPWRAQDLAGFSLRGAEVAAGRQSRTQGGELGDVRRNGGVEGSGNSQCGLEQERHARGSGAAEECRGS